MAAEDDTSTQPGAVSTPGTLYRYRLGHAEFDEARFELRVGGLVVELQQKPLQLLALLLSRPGEVFGKDQIVAAVWKHPTGDAPLANAVSKLRGALGAEQAQAIVTVARQGYKFDGAVERVAVGRRLESRLDLAAGKPVPGRESYQLAQLLGRSRSNETWLARQPRSGDLRVFKFATRDERLAELKREATLFRLLHDTLGPRSDIARVLDWNFEQGPYWLECEYGGRSLSAWAAEPAAPEEPAEPTAAPDAATPPAATAPTRLQAATVAQRLALLLQIADAVAAAHGAGVLHKDLKPANVLVQETPGGGWQLRLTDFGSGRLLDPERLAELRITQLGMTLAPGGEGSSGKPYYLAPEVARGEAPSTRSDVFALGVMLYQLLAGDLQRLLAPGWEREIEDPLLRADIAEATDLDPTRRLASAAELAARLRALPARQQAAAAAAEASETARRAAAARARARARRPWVRAAAAALLLGSAASLWGYLSQRRAAEALAQQVAVAESLNRLVRDDLIAAANPAASGRADITVADALVAAAGRIDSRFGSAAPTVRAQLHMTAQDALSNLSRYADAVAAGRRALLAWQAAQAAAPGTDPGTDPQSAQPAQQARLRLAVDLVQLSRLDEAAAVVREIEALPQPADTAFRARLLYARAWLTAGDFQLAESTRLLEEALALVRPLSEDQMPGRDRILFGLADNYRLLGRGADSEALYRELLAGQTQRLGAGHTRAQVTRMGLATALSQQGRDDEARPLLQGALVALTDKLGPRHRLTLSARDNLAAIDYRRRDYGAAASAWAEVHAGYAALMGEDSSYTLTVLTGQAQALFRAGQAAAAEPLLRDALRRARKNVGENTPQVQQIRYALAELLLERRQPAEVGALLTGLEPAALNLAQQETDWPQRLAALRQRLAGFQVAGAR